jgi:hypothetical protein
MDASRRRWLRGAVGAWLAAGGAPAGAALARGEHAPPKPSLRVALAWDDPAPGADGEPAHCVGVWALAAGRVDVLARREVPTRAHGIARGVAGELLAVARRPGLWLQRWADDGRLLRQAWAEPGRRFNGHVLASDDGRWLWSTEQHDVDGAGVVALRDPRTLALLDEWPTGGTDPHQLLMVGDTLYVANGGVPTRPETGRAKQSLTGMDSSLVAFDRRSGRRLGTWRLADPRLSLRHLAWHAPSGLLGIALQAEHDDPAERAAAPVLACFDGQRLWVPTPPRGTGGYAGDIAATEEGFCLGATRAGALLSWSVQRGWSAPLPLAEACAVLAGPAGAWGFGAQEGRGPDPLAPAVTWPSNARPDNHAWVLA